MMRLPQASAISSGRTTFPRSAHFSSSCMTSTRCSTFAPSMAGRTQLSCVRPSSLSRDESRSGEPRVGASRFADVRGVPASDERGEPSSSPLALDASPSTLNPRSRSPSRRVPSPRAVSRIHVVSLCVARASARKACSRLKRSMCLAMSVARMSVATRSRNRALSRSCRNATIPTSSSSSSSKSNLRWKCSRMLSGCFLYSACLLFFRNALFRRKWPASCPSALRYSASTSTGSKTPGGNPLCRKCVAASTSCGQIRGGET